jgi:3'-5' exoribonuclease
MRTYIRDFRKGDIVVDFFYVTSHEVKETSKKKPYLQIQLMDRTGDIVAKLWDAECLMLKLPEKEGHLPTWVTANDFSSHPKKGEYVKVEAVVGEFAGKLDFNVKRCRVATVSEFDLNDIIPCSERRPLDMLTDYLQLVKDSCPGSLVSIHVILPIMNKYSAELMASPAAQKNHHAFVGGLAEHILSLGQMAVMLGNKYKARVDLLLAACLLHDVGKIYEISPAIGFNYTTPGSLVGHIGYGLILLEQFKSSFLANGGSEADYIHLQHLVVSHHGQKDWGALVTPMTKEAMLFHLMDMIDSRMALIDAMQSEQLEESGRTMNFQRSWGGYAFPRGINDAISSTDKPPAIQMEDDADRKQNGNDGPLLDLRSSEQ